MLLEARPRLAPPPLGLRSARLLALMAVARGFSSQLFLGDGVLLKELKGDKGGSIPRFCIMDDGPFISAWRIGAPSEAAREDVSPAARTV